MARTLAPAGESGPDTHSDLRLARSLERASQRARARAHERKTQRERGAFRIRGPAVGSRAVACGLELGGPVRFSLANDEPTRSRSRTPGAPAPAAHPAPAPAAHSHYRAESSVGYCWGSCMSASPGDMSPPWPGSGCDGPACASPTPATRHGDAVNIQRALPRSVSVCALTRRVCVACWR